MTTHATRRECTAFSTPVPLSKTPHFCKLSRGHPGRHLCGCGHPWGRKPAAQTAKKKPEAP